MPSLIFFFFFFFYVPANATDFAPHHNACRKSFTVPPVAISKRKFYKVARFVRAFADFCRSIRNFWQDFVSVDGNLFDIVKKVRCRCRRNFWQVIMSRTSTQDGCIKRNYKKRGRKNDVCLLFLRLLFIKYRARNFYPAKWGLASRTAKTCAPNLDTSKLARDAATFAALTNLKFSSRTERRVHLKRGKVGSIGFVQSCWM